MEKEAAILKEASSIVLTLGQINKDENFIILATFLENLAKVYREQKNSVS